MRDYLEYKGFPNVLSYYNAQPLELKSLGRGDLCREHPGLYRTLSRRGFLAEAIPGEKKRGRHPLSKTQIEKIVEFYGTCGGNARKISRESGISLPRVYRGLKDLKLPAIGKPEEHYLSKGDVSKIISLYSIFRRNATKVGEESGFSRFTVVKCLRLNGLNPEGKRGPKISRRI